MAKRIFPWLVAGATAITTPAQAQQVIAPPAIAAPPDGAPLAPPPPAPPTAEASASLVVGERPDFTRLSFRFPVATTVTPILANNRLELRFSRAVDIDLAQVRADLPHFVRGVTRVSRPGQPLRIALDLDPGVRQRHFVDAERVVVDLLAPDGSQPTTTQTVDGALPEVGQLQGPPAPRGAASVRVAEDASATRISVRWPSPARAAAFRRGEAIWLAFEASGSIDLRNVARAGRRHQDMEVVQGDGVIALRIPAAPDVQVSAAADGASWTFTLSARSADTPDAPVTLDTSHAASLIVDFQRTGVVKYLDDPEVGDRLIVALLSGPVMGVDMRRSTLEAAILPSAQGAVVEQRADGIGAMFQNGKLIVSREAGLLSAADQGGASSAASAIESALIETDSGGVATALNDRQIRDRIDALTRRAAAEGTAEGAPVEARMALARFLVESELAPEALGALRVAAINQPEIDLDPDFRLLRAAANVMMRRVADAQRDLSASVLADNPAASLWRGYAASLDENWADARRELERGAGALETFPPNWRARFALARAQAALELNDFDAAEESSRAVVGQAASQTLRLHARLVDARVMAARGRENDALALFDELSRARDEEVAVRAQLEAIKIRRASGQLALDAAADKLEALRYRWRGDDLEVQIVGALGSIYAEMQRWRDALATMRVAADRFPNAPETRRLTGDMQAIFTRLFLEGEADKLEPIQALGLFYEFSDLTPIGPDGDRIVRGLAGRLVAVDLLEQAENLLQHQVDERLEGLGKAQVASELAAIYLMDRKPEQALVTINSTRIASLPPALVAERRILEARAHLDLGRLDHAVELVERDQSVDAQRVRADAAWRARDWERASAELRTLLRLRGHAHQLDEDSRMTVLRTAIALTLSQDNDGVRALYRDYAGDMSGTPQADAFEVVAGGANVDGVSIRDVARAVARTDLLDRFLGGIRARMTASAPEAQAAQTGPTAQAAPAPAAPPTQGASPRAAAPPAAPATPAA